MITKKLNSMSDFKKLPKDDRQEIIDSWFMEVVSCYDTETIDGKYYKDGELVDESWAMDWIENDVEDGGIWLIKYRPSRNVDIIQETWITGRYADDEYWQDKVKDDLNL